MNVLPLNNLLALSQGFPCRQLYNCWQIDISACTCPTKRDPMAGCLLWALALPERRSSAKREALLRFLSFHHSLSWNWAKWWT